VQLTEARTREEAKRLEGELRMKARASAKVSIPFRPIRG
jgi:hypothetical protein